MGIELVGAKAPQFAAAPVRLRRDIGLNKAGIPLAAFVVPVVAHDHAARLAPRCSRVLVELAVVPQQRPSDLGRSAHDVHEFGLPKLEQLLEPLVGCQPDEVVAPGLLAQVDELCAVEAAVGAQNDDRIGPAGADEIHKGFKVFDHDLPAVLVAVVHGDRKAVDEGQKR